jgi:hypothetical protein
MRQGLIRVMRPDKRGTPRAKWVRPEGVVPPSQANSSRRKLYQEKRNAVLEIFGGKCVRCGYSEDKRALCLDHIHGGGAKDRRGQSGVSWWYKVLKNPDPTLYQLLCSNCNIIKRDEERELYK